MEIDINQHEHMKNALHNINNQQYLSYNHQYKIIDEYNNPTLILCMFPSLFPFEIWWSLKWKIDQSKYLYKYILIKHLMNLNEIYYKFSKHHLFPFFVFNIIQQRQVCLGAKLTIFGSSNTNE
jgi:hypothetical protein